MFLFRLSFVTIPSVTFYLIGTPFLGGVFLLACFFGFLVFSQFFLMKVVTFLNRRKEKRKRKRKNLNSNRVLKVIC